MRWVIAIVGTSSIMSWASATPLVMRAQPVRRAPTTSIVARSSVPAPQEGLPVRGPRDDAPGAIDEIGGRSQPIPADQPERAMAFYQQVFGWRFQQWEGPMPYWLAQTGGEGPGIDGGLLARQHPGQGTVNTVDVPNCEEFVRRIESAGGRTVMPKMGVPGVGWLAYCADPEGNTFGVMQNDPAAS